MSKGDGNWVPVQKPNSGGGSHMKSRICAVGIVFVLLVAANTVAAGGLTGVWRLTVNVVTPIACQYEDGGMYINQEGLNTAGTANLRRIGVGGCPPTLLGTIQGNMGVDPLGGAPFSFFWMFPQGPFTISGQFRDSQNAAGTFTGTYLNTPATGTWTLRRVGAPAVPATTPWGLIILAALAGLGAVYYLRKKRIAVG
jgi:hypothetical protein